MACKRKGRVYRDGLGGWKLGRLVDAIGRIATIRANTHPGGRGSSRKPWSNDRLQIIITIDLIPVS